MIRRAALLLAMVSFGLAWIVGVWCGHSPLVRLQSALLALVAGAAGGAGIGVALQKIVLARLAEQWRELESGEEARRTAAKNEESRKNGAKGASARVDAARSAPAPAAEPRPRAMAEAAR